MTKSGKEIVEFQAMFEHIKIDDHHEIILQLIPSRKDDLTEYLISENQLHIIDSDMITVDEICSRLVRNIIKYTNTENINFLLMGLREMMINAVEHGNLNITYDEKTTSLNERNYLALLKERREDPKYKDKKIKIEYKLYPEKVLYKITDEGKGFDHESIRKIKSTALNKELSLHGRGIKMTESVFDEVTFNQKGNSVTLLKYFKSKK